VGVVNAARARVWWMLWTQHEHVCGECCERSTSMCVVRVEMQCCCCCVS